MTPICALLEYESGLQSLFSLQTVRSVCRDLRFGVGHLRHFTGKLGQRIVARFIRGSSLRRREMCERSAEVEQMFRESGSLAAVTMVTRCSYRTWISPSFFQSSKKAGVCSKEQRILDPTKAEGIDAFPAIQMDFYSTFRCIFTLFMALFCFLLTLQYSISVIFTLWHP